LNLYNKVIRMIHRLKLIIITVSLSCSLAACSESMPATTPQPENSNSAPVAEQSNANKEPAAPAQARKADRPLFKQGTVGLEGTEQKMTFKLFDSSSVRHSIPFTTYVPEDITSVAGSSSEGEAVTFSANFDRKPNPSAYLHIFIYLQEISEEAARQTIEIHAHTRGRQERRSDAPKRFKWSLAEHDFMNQTKSGEWLMGTIALGKHNDRFFYVIIQYPEDYEEGFVPRAYRILDEWRWGDTDTGL
jgi:hypothetical protein